MRTWIVMIALAGFLPQLFSCCALECGECTEPAFADDEHCCHHQHDTKPVRSPQPEPSHHLCVATHLFYVVRGDVAAPQLDWNAYAGVLPVAGDAVDSTQLAAQTRNVSVSLRLRSALRCRAESGVWIL